MTAPAATFDYSLTDASAIARVVKHIKRARGVFVVAGERDAEVLHGLGCVGVCIDDNAKISRAQLEPLKGARLLVLADNNSRAHVASVARTLERVASVVRVIDLPNGGDLSAWIGAGAGKAQLTALAGEALARASVLPEGFIERVKAEKKKTKPAPTRSRPQTSTRSEQSPTVVWSRFDLKCNGNGQPYPNLANVVRVLTLHADFTGHLWYDEFANRIMTTLGGTAPRQLEDGDVLNLTVALQERLELARVDDGTMHKACMVVARGNRRNALREKLESLTWDRKRRLAALFVDGFGAKDSDYAVKVSENFLIGAVARVYSPGCKLDTMVTLEGPQGAKKSTALAILGGEWFTEVHETIGTKDFYLALDGKWIIELAELASFTKADVDKLKGVLSCPTDRYRAPWARLAADYARRCVFVGSTNEEMYLRDPSGARRFWPIECGHIDVGWLRANREQLLAEAVAAFKAGAKWWEMPEVDTQKEQEGRRRADPWEAIIDDWLTGKNDATAREILSDALKLEPGRQDTSAMMRVAAVLKRLGFRKYQRGNDRVRAWQRML
jgi:Virulence-associated protein E-like domain